MLCLQSLIVCVEAVKRRRIPRYSADIITKLVGLLERLGLYINIGIKHGFSCINIRQVPWEVLKNEAGGRGFQHLPRDLAINKRGRRPRFSTPPKGPGEC